MNDWMIKWTAFPEWIVSGRTWLKRSCRDLRAQRAPSWRLSDGWASPLEVSIFNFLTNVLSSDLQLRIEFLTFSWMLEKVSHSRHWNMTDQWVQEPPLNPTPPIFFFNKLIPHTEDPLTLGFQSLSEPHLLLVSLCGIQPPLNYFPFGPSPLGSHPPHRWPSAREQRWESVGRLIYRREGGQQRLESLHYLTSSYLACILRRGLIYWCFCTFVGLKQQFQRTRGRWRGNLRSVLRTSYESCYGAIILERNF